MTRIIDAVSSPTTDLQTQKSSSGGMNIPVKIDASQMQQMLQSLVSQQIPQANVPGVQTTPAAGERVNPSIYIKNISDEMEQLYSRFDRLKKLAVELHGKQIDAPIPEHVKIKKVSIDFSVIKDGKEEQHTADIHAITTVGDISNLMSTEFGMLIMTLTERAKQLEDIAQKTGERCSSALKEWEKNNQDKKIVRGDEMTSVSSAADEMPVTNAPVTLEAS